MITERYSVAAGKRGSYRKCRMGGVEVRSAQPRRKVLIVDGEETNRKVFQELLRNDYELLTAADSGEAWRLITRNQEALSAILLDAAAPAVDAQALLSSMRGDCMLKGIPVLVTGKDDGDIPREEVLSLYASDFISQVYDADILKRRLSNLIQMHEARVKIDALQRDEVTGLYTRVAFAEHAARVLREQPDVEWNMIAMDIEHFKLVNESYGQRIGNELLAYLAKKLHYFSATKNCVCVRSYADHFFMLVERRDIGYIRARHAELTEYLQKFPLDMKMSLKFGVYEIYDREMEVDSMCDRAQIAVNQIKGEYVQEICFYDDSLRRQMIMEQHITDEMEQALKEEQFQVYFQPKFDIFSETLSGAEALVRWIHPKNGFMAPGEFVPVFERNGFITEVDMFVWDKACEKIREWIDKYDRYVPISVNVSRRDIYKPGLPQVLVDIVHKHGLEPRHLHLEITESAYVENADQLLTVVAQLKEAGFTIEMDDFGSGYSSLNMLAEMPIDMLKLDMKFVQNYSEGNNTRSIMSFVIGLAKWMNLYVIAEGVETKEQLDLLRGMDCNLGQGYYFSKPLSEEEFVKLLRASGKTLADAEDQAIRFSNIQDDAFQTMLVVDGLAINRLVLIEYFKNVYSIVEATGGKAALQYLKHVRQADIVVADAHLPDMEASEFIRELKKDPRMERVAVIVTTHGSNDTVGKVIAAGADACVKKPFTKVQMHDCISRIMSVRGEQMKHEEEAILDKMRMMEMLTTKDYLTGLWNRVELEKRIRDHIKHSPDRQFYYISVDIDGYKTLINEHGYAMGDKALHEVAERLESCFQDIDVVGRISGDRFAVFLNAAIDSEELLVRMAHLQSRLSFELNGIPITCSCGVSQFPQCGEDFDGLYRAAEQALDAAKDAGKNCFRVCEMCCG